LFNELKFPEISVYFSFSPGVKKLRSGPDRQHSPNR